MATMTFNLNEQEMAVLEALAAEQDMSKTQLLKQALRLYQLIVARRKNGETISFSGDRERIVEFVGPGFSHFSDPSKAE